MKIKKTSFNLYCPRAKRFVEICSVYSGFCLNFWGQRRQRVIVVGALGVTCRGGWGDLAVLPVRVVSCASLPVRADVVLVTTGRKLFTALSHRSASYLTPCLGNWTWHEEPRRIHFFTCSSPYIQKEIADFDIFIFLFYWHNLNTRNGICRHIVWIYQN